MATKSNAHFTTVAIILANHFDIESYAPFIKFRIDEMSERIDDLESTVSKLVEKSN